MNRNFLIKKERNIEKLKEYLFIIFIACMLLVGILLLISPWLRDIMIKETAMNYSLSNFTAEEIAENQENAEETPWDLTIDTPNFATVLTNISKVNQKDVLGAISIGDVDIMLPILNGTNTQNLLVGATTVIEEQVMGEGNFVLAGHHMRDDTLLFGPLLHVKVGTFVQITDKTNVYTYQVVNKAIVKETDVSVLEETSVPTITLFTCDVSGIKTDKRVVIRGELVDISSYSVDNEYVNMYKLQESENKETQNYFLVFLIILLICLVSLIVYRIYVCKVKRRN